MKYYLIAGEPSGDLHGSNLMKAIKLLDPEADFRHWGGDKMKDQGGVQVRHYNETAFMGFLEVAKNLNTILRHLRFCKKDLRLQRPDVLVLIDYPGFNLRIAEYAKSIGLRVVYYISPQVWAWKQSRVKTIKKNVDQMLVILPFEQAFYKKFDYPVEFVGHPLLDALPLQENTNHKASFFAQYPDLEGKKLVALLPGSRKQEIESILPTMLAISGSFPEHQFVVASAPSIPDEVYQKHIVNHSATLIKENTYKLLQAADAALVTSGTATLETAILGTPEVVCYKGNAISFEIAKRLVDVKYISLVNLIMDEEIVKELIQHDFTVSNLRQELQTILYDKGKRTTMLEQFKALREQLGSGGASKRAAEKIFKALQG